MHTQNSRENFGLDYKSIAIKCDHTEQGTKFNVTQIVFLPVVL